MDVGNPPLADDDLGIDAWRVDVAEDVRHATDGASGGGWPPGELDDDHFAGRRAALLARRHDDVHQHAPIERRDVAHAAVVAVVAAHERAVAALEDTDHPAFRASAVLDPLDADHDAVPVHRLLEL